MIRRAPAPNAAVAAIVTIIAMTDGVATQDTDNGRAVSALVEHQVPFFGIGCGRETESRILTLEHVVGPPLASPKQEFHYQCIRN